MYIFIHYVHHTTSCTRIYILDALYAAFFIYLFTEMQNTMQKFYTQGTIHKDKDNKQ
jgi:hypothetical protein